MALCPFDSLGLGEVEGKVRRHLSTALSVCIPADRECERAEHLFLLVVGEKGVPAAFTLTGGAFSMHVSVSKG